jgi:hypothetical protein
MRFARNCLSSPELFWRWSVRGRTRVGETRVRRWSYERLSRDPPLHIRSSRSQTSGALCAQMSPPNSYRKVHTKINVSCTAGPIACSSNDSARDPVGTTFLLTGGSKSSVQLPTRLPPTWKPETAPLSDCARNICFSPLATMVGRFTSALVASLLPNVDALCNRQ